MWNFLFGFLFARATGISRFVRPLLAFLFLGAILAAVVYTGVVINAVQERTSGHHVHTHSSH